LGADMAEPRRSEAEVLLQVQGLNVYYGRSHALQGVDLTLDRGVQSVVGRNGMGKTTLCKAIMGLARASSGSIRVRGEELLGLRRRSRATASDMCRRVGGCGARSQSTSTCA
jgi:ABC-type branched-subunit amino acid transport system ATPase component